MNECHNVQRRDFSITCAKAVITLALFDLPSVAGRNLFSNYSLEEISIDLSLPANNALAKIDGAQYIQFPGENFALIVIRNSQSKVSAFSSKCSHLSNKVDLPVNRVCTCPLHGSQFNDEGGVIKGPATTNLKKFYPRIEGNFIYISNTTSIKHSSKSSQQGQISITHDQPQKRITISFKGPYKKADVSITAVNGRMVKSFIGKRMPHVVFSINDLAAGNYLISVRVDDTNFRQVFIVR